MFYRVDVLLAAMLAGLGAAALLRRRAAHLGPVYLAATLAVVAASAALMTVGSILGYGPELLVAVGIVGVLGNMLVGAAVVLGGSQVLFALRVATGVSFVLSALGKAFAMDFMVTFFSQSGYSIGFLHFIMAAEVVGGLVLLLPWTGLIYVAAAGLAIDMFGAIVTHAHNGDPLDDSTGAIGMLIRLGIITSLTLALGRRMTARSAAAMLGVAVVAAGFAIVGAMGLRAKTKTASAAPAEAFDDLVGVWHCAGTLAASGKPIEADLHFDKDPDLGGWLLFRHDDRPPNAYHALAEWRKTPSGLVAAVEDSFGGLRLFRSTGWQDRKLSWEGGDVGATPATQRFIYEQKSPVELEVRYETLRASGWQLGDSSTCTRTR